MGAGRFLGDEGVASVGEGMGRVGEVLTLQGNVRNFFGDEQIRARARGITNRSRSCAFGAIASSPGSRGKILAQRIRSPRSICRIECKQANVAG